MSDDLHVHRHGDRWALADAPGASPISEYATCAEAELAARAILRERGGTGEVIVSSEDPTGLDAAQEPGAGQEIDTGVETGSGGKAPERLRSQQAGF